MRSGRCRRQPKATLRLYKPRQMAVCLYSPGPSDAGRMFRNAHVRISRACRPLRQGEHHHCTDGLSPVRPQAFPAALRTGCRVRCQARQTTASQATTFLPDVTKSIAAPSYYGEGYLPRAFFAEGKERKKGRTAMKKRVPFAVFLFPSFGRFSTMRSNGLFAPYRRRAWEQSSTQKRNLFSERKSSMESDDSMELWCDRRDLNPYPYRTRPSNVRVCQFRHDRALRFCNDRYYIGFGGRLSR